MNTSFQPSKIATKQPRVVVSLVGLNMENQQQQPRKESLSQNVTVLLLIFLRQSQSCLAFNILLNRQQGRVLLLLVYCLTDIRSQIKILPNVTQNAFNSQPISKARWMGGGGESSEGKVSNLSKISYRRRGGRGRPIQPFQISYEMMKKIAPECIPEELTQ